MKYKFFTNLSIDECQARIRKNANTQQGILMKLRAWKNTDGFIGSIGEKNFWIQKNKLNVRNNFSRAFFGRFTEKDSKTIIEGSFKIHKITKIFLRIWFSIILYIMFMFCLATFFSKTGGATMNSSLGFPVMIIILTGFACFPILLSKLGKYLSQEQEEWILDFIKNDLEAREKS